MCDILKLKNYETLQKEMKEDVRDGEMYCARAAKDLI
jgi:hypothetical protein